MELLYDVSQVAIGGYDGTSMIAHLRDFSSKLQSVYTFENVEDTLEVVNDNTTNVQVTGNISLWIGNGVRIYIYVYKYNNSSYYKLHPRIGISGKTGTYYTIGDGSVYSTSGAETMYHGYAIYKTNRDQIIISYLQSNAANSTPSSKGLSLMIGTATNVYTNEKLPTLVSFRYVPDLSWYYNGSHPDYLNATQSTNQYCIANALFQQTSVVSLPCTWSDIAVACPVVSQNGHWVVDDLLVTMQVPKCFSNSTSVVEYGGHTYAQVGRYLFLDENDSED